MADTTPSPQAQLKAARAGLLTSLVAAAKAVESETASPALVAQALQGVVSAQQAYNNAVVRIPLSVMTDGVIFNDMAAQAEPPDGPGTTLHPAAHISGTNARVWADTFLAVNKNQAIDRESLVEWFANAIENGIEHGARTATG